MANNNRDVLVRYVKFRTSMKLHGRKSQLVIQARKGALLKQ